MFKVVFATILIPLPALAGSCGGALVQICPDSALISPPGSVQDPGVVPTPNIGRKVIRQAIRPAAFGAGDAFAVTEHSVLMDPQRYGLAPVTGTWRYYVLDGFLYRVDSVTSRVIDVRRAPDARLR